MTGFIYHYLRLKEYLFKCTLKVLRVSASLACASSRRSLERVRRLTHGATLVAQWQGAHLSRQGTQDTQVRSLGGKVFWRRWQPTPVLLPEKASLAEEPGGSQRAGRGRVTEPSSGTGRLQAPRVPPDSRPLCCPCRTRCAHTRERLHACTDDWLELRALRGCRREANPQERGCMYAGSWLTSLDSRN